MKEKPYLQRPLPQVFLILGVAILCYFPFANKALHIDADMLVHTARQIIENPVDPPLGDYGHHMVLHDKTKMPETSVFFRCGHPPLLPAILAGSIVLFGDREWVFHTVLFVFYVLAIVSVWIFLGMFFSPGYQSAGALLWTVSPSLLVNSHNVMWDVPITALMLFSLVLFLLGLRKDNGIFILFSGIVTGLAALTKTNALPLYFLFGPCLILKRKWRFLLLWCIPAILLPLIWVGHNIIVYKKIQYISIGWFGLSPGDVRYRIERFVSYAGGALMLPVFWYWLMLARRNFRALAITSSIAVFWGTLLVVVLKEPVWLGLAYSFFTACDIWVLWKSVFVKLSGTGAESYESRLIGAYSLLYMGIMIMLPSAMVRYMLPLIPVGLIVLGEEIRFLKHRRLFLSSAILFSFVFSITLACADYFQSDSDRKLPYLLNRKGYYPEDTWYFGRLSFDYYLSRAGYRNIRIDKDKPQKGHYLVENVIPGDYKAWEFLQGLTAVPVDTINLYNWPVRTMGFKGGFYGADRIPYSVKFGAPQKSYCVFVLQ